MKHALYTLALLACLVGLPIGSFAQHRQQLRLTYTDVSLGDALSDLNNVQADYVVNFLYNELEDFRVTATVSCKSVPEAIQQLIGFYPVRMTVKREDHEIYVECTHRTDRHLRGIILDEQGQAVAYANVAILNPADSTLLGGGVSNESGYFVIPYEQAAVLARITYVGYKPLFILCHQEDVGTISMQPDYYTLSSVTVKGQVQQYQMGSEGLVARVENTPLARLGTAADVLRHVPGIIQVNDGYEVFGKGTPIIYINGRLVRNPKELEQLKSTDIKQIELISTPGSKYDATVGAVVKIQTVRRQGDGLSIDTWGRLQQGRKDKEAASLDMNYRHDGLDVFSSVWWSRGKHLQIAQIAQEVVTDRLWQQSNHMHSLITSRDITTEAGFNYQLHERHTLGAKYEFTVPTNTDDRTTLAATVTAGGEFYDRWENLTRKQIHQRAGHKVNAYYVGKVGQADVDCNIDYLHSGYDEGSLIEETCQVEDDRLLDAVNKVRNTMLASKLTVTYPLFGGRVDFGAEYTATTRQDDYVNPQHFVASTYSTLKQQSLCPYAQYTRELPRIGTLRAGLRYEHVAFDYYDNGNLVEAQSRNYGNIYPSASLQTKLGQLQAQLAYTVKTRRPTYRELSCDVFYGNRYSLSRGNPLLSNTVEHTLSLQAMWQYVQLTLAYSDERDAIMHWMEPIDQTNVIMVTYKNIASLKAFTPFVTIAPTVGIWRPQCSLGLRKQWLTIATTAGRVHLNKPIVLAQLSNTFACSSSLTAELGITYQSPGHNQNVYMDYHRAVVDVSLVKTFSPSLTLRLAGEDLLDRNRDAYFCHSPQVTFWQANFHDRRRFVVTIRYNFNATRRSYKGTGAGNDEKQRL